MESDKRTTLPDPFMLTNPERSDSLEVTDRFRNRYGTPGSKGPLG